MKWVTLRWRCTNSEASGSSESKECCKAALRTACLDPLHSSAVSWSSFLHYRSREVAKTRRVLIKYTTVYRTEFPENLEGWAGGGVLSHPQSTFLGETQHFHTKIPDSQSHEPQPRQKLCLHWPLLHPSHHHSGRIQKPGERGSWNERAIEGTRGKADQTYCLSRPQGLVLCLSKQQGTC